MKERTGRSSSRAKAPSGRYKKGKLAKVGRVVVPRSSKYDRKEPHAALRNTPGTSMPGFNKSKTGPRSFVASAGRASGIRTRSNDSNTAPNDIPENKWKKPSGRPYVAKPSVFKKRTPLSGSSHQGPGKSMADHDGKIRLNKFLSNAGVASRRDADSFIKAGLVSVNGKIVVELGTRIKPSDEVKYNGAKIRNEKLRYFLINKPKDYICTTDDPQERKTVMELVKKVCKERIYPVGRLDRNTTGLLLMTNDGDLAQKLMHPRTNVKKIYQVELDKNIKKEHFENIAKGVELEDGFIKPDELAMDLSAHSKRIIGITLHSGKNRIVRRIFEHFDYEVVKLDRVYYAGLTKKDLPRGHVRPLTELELNMLKMISLPKK